MKLSLGSQESKTLRSVSFSENSIICLIRSFYLQSLEIVNPLKGKVRIVRIWKLSVEESIYYEVLMRIN